MTRPQPDFLDSPMVDALVRGVAPAADVPHAQELMLFGQFVGAWDVEVAYHGPDGRTEVKRGEWLFGWVLEGQGVQDVWRVPSRAEAARTGAPLSGYGTTVRFYDPRLGAWRSTWHGLVKGEVIPFIGREIGVEIHLEHREDGGQLRGAGPSPTSRPRASGGATSVRPTAAGLGSGSRRCGPGAGLTCRTSPPLDAGRMILPRP